MKCSRCRSRRPAAAGSASLTSNGTRDPGGTLTSARTARIAEIAATTHSISAAAARSAMSGDNSGHDAAISKPASSPAKYCHSSSVMNGMIGCSSRRICPSTQAVIARVSARADASSPCRIGLVNSTYQSQNVPHTN